MYKHYSEQVKAQRSGTSSPVTQTSKQNAKSPKLDKKPPKGKAADPKPLDRQKSTWDKDVMISYSHLNRPFMRQLREALQKRGISVWVDETGLKAGVDFLSKIGQAIIDAKCFISLLSVESIKSKYCQDELALAYVSQKHIFPCGLAPAEELFPSMDTGMKLQLARFRWTVFKDEALFEQNMDILVENMKSAMSGEDTKTESKPKIEGQAKKTHVRASLNKTKRKSVLLDRMSSENDTMSDKIMGSFWPDNFFDKQVVPWPEFHAVFLEVYKEPLTMLYTHSDREWLIGIIRRELEVRDPANGVVSRDAFDDFCTVDDEVMPFFVRVQDQAVESYTMKEVFSMESSVRIEAIENLGKFHSAAVVEALLDLLQDPDNNVRAVAAISLARTGDDNDKIVGALMETLSDKDRLVRESGCLALGHLKAGKAVRKILHLWRNDFISHVREAAQVALEQIGGEEAENAIHMTKVLSEEIRYLAQE